MEKSGIVTSLVQSGLIESHLSCYLRLTVKLKHLWKPPYCLQTQCGERLPGESYSDLVYACPLPPPSKWVDKLLQDATQAGDLTQDPPHQYMLTFDKIHHPLVSWRQTLKRRISLVPPLILLRTICQLQKRNRPSMDCETGIS